MWLLNCICNSILRVWFFIFDRLILYRIMRQLSPNYNIHFMNLGYWPTKTSIKNDEKIRKLIVEHSLDMDLDRPHYYLYERALLFHRNYPALDGLQILEVGCGQGYGLQWIKRAHPEIKAIQGVDRFATQGTSIIFGDAHHLPFEDNRFDLVLNVESSHLYQDCEQFFRECSRVLKKGGHLCWTDLRFEKEVAETRKQAFRAGLVEQRWDDVTDNVLQGIHRTSARYDQILRKTPLLVRLFSSSLRATYCAPGTYTYARFVRREKGYYAAIWENK